MYGGEHLRTKGRYIGIGLSCYAELTAQNAASLQDRGIKRVPGYDSSTVKVEPSGKVTVASSVIAEGTGKETVLAQVVADELGLEMSDITVILGDTGQTPYGSGTWSSRGAVGAGGASRRASRQIKRKMQQIAARHLEANPDDVVLHNGHLEIEGAPWLFMTFEDTARLAYMVSDHQLPEGIDPGLEVTDFYDPPRLTVSNATQIAVAEVDIETGQIALLKYVIVHDCGPMINPMIVEGQIHGGVAQGLGQGLYEAVHYDTHGQVLNASLLDYLVPTATEVPLMDVDHLETPSPLTEGGVKGMGEGGTVGAPAAIVNAVADALSPFGVQLTTLPITPDLIRRAMRGVVLD